MNDKFFYRVNDEGNAVILHKEDGWQATKLDANVYPIGSDLSARNEHPAGIILTIEDAEKIGIHSENYFFGEIVNTEEVIKTKDALVKELYFSFNISATLIEHPEYVPIIQEFVKLCEAGRLKNRK